MLSQIRLVNGKMFLRRYASTCRVSQIESLCHTLVPEATKLCQLQYESAAPVCAGCGSCLAALPGYCCASLRAGLSNAWRRYQAVCWTCSTTRLMLCELAWLSNAAARCKRAERAAPGSVPELHLRGCAACAMLRHMHHLPSLLHVMPGAGEQRGAHRARISAHAHSLLTAAACGAEKLLEPEQTLAECLGSDRRTLFTMK